MMKRIIGIGIWSALLGLALAVALAQDEPPEPAKTPPARSQNSSGEQVVQIEISKAVLEGELPLTLSRAVELALERNPALTVEKIHLEQARGKIEEEKGYYDPLFNLRASLGSRDNVVASRFYPTGVYIDDERAQGVGIQTRIYGGGRFSIDLDYKRLKSTSNTQTLSPQYSANFGLTFVQPLLRDFGWDVSFTRIRVAEKGEEIAEHVLWQRISQLIQQVEEAYWNLIFLRQDAEVKKTSLEFAQELLKQSEALFRADRIAGVSVLEARAGVAGRKEALITAENETKKFEDRLKVFLHIGLDKVNLTPSDKLSFAPLQMNLEKSLELALAQRPEMIGMKIELEQRELEKKFAANQTLPRLDFTAQYGMAGLSGRPNKTCVDPTATVCVPVGRSVDGSVFAGQTRPSDAFDRFFTRNPFDNWSVELKLQVPLWNRTAEAQLSDANLRLSESKTRIRALRDQIEAEVRDAIRETSTAATRIDASREAVKFAEAQLTAARQKFEAGLTTSYEVLQVLNDLAKFRTSEIKALMDHNVGSSKVRLAEGSVLEKHNIELKKPPRFVFNDNPPKAPPP